MIDTQPNFVITLGSPWLWDHKGSKRGTRSTLWPTTTSTTTPSCWLCGDWEASPVAGTLPSMPKQFNIRLSNMCCIKGQTVEKYMSIYFLIATNRLKKPRQSLWSVTQKQGKRWRRLFKTSNMHTSSPLAEWRTPELLTLQPWQPGQMRARPLCRPSWKPAAPGRSAPSSSGHQAQQAGQKASSTGKSCFVTCNFWCDLSSEIQIRHDHKHVTTDWCSIAPSQFLLILYQCSDN